MGLPDVVAGDVRVDLRGRDVGVAQHRLHTPEIRSASEQVRRERVPQPVRVHRVREPDGERVTAHDLPESLPRQRLPAGRWKEETRFGGLARFRHASRVPRGAILVEMAERHGAERYEPALLPLAERGNDAPPPVDVPEFERDELAHSEAGGVRDAQHRAVAEAAEGSRVRSVKEAEHVILRERSRKPSPGTWSRRERRRVCLELAFANEETHEAAEGGEVPGRRAGAKSRLCEAAEIGAHHPEIDGFRALDVAIRAKYRKSSQIRAVRREGVRREPPLDPEVREIRVDERLNLQERSLAGGSRAGRVLLRPGHLSPALEGAPPAIRGRPREGGEAVTASWWSSR